MDQKNTIVKCKAHPDCLFNHNGVCDNYVINISTDGKCECYVETENVYAPPSTQEILEYAIKLEQEKLRGQRAKCDFIQDGVDQEIVNEVCKPLDIKPSATATLNGITTDNWVEMYSKLKTCHPDCIHFYDSDPMVGPVCLFNHPEPLKKFYEGMPCDYYHSVNYTRNQRSNCNIYDDACDVSFLKEDLEKIQQTLEQDSIPCTIKVAELNKPNKNKSIISDWDYAATPDICKTCKKVVYGQPCKWKDVVYGVWTCYEEEKNEI